VKALVFHLLRGTGTVAENLQLLHQEKLSPSSMSERRANLPFKVFQTILGSALRPKAQEETHPEANGTKLSPKAPRGRNTTAQGNALVTS